jgi:nicotinic acid mononucleotide adenylyltransferase
VVLDMAPVDLSSTGVREALRAGDGDALVRPEVLALIRSQSLYGGVPC